MRRAFARAVLDNAEDENLFFLTGDLGFMALEEVRAAFGNRFINAGVAEQNMVGVAAGLALEGMRVFVYSIAPFCYARPFEQIRNDICMNGLPVCLVGNGGGYAYGYMGPTHHALEDCATMNALGVKVIVPSFNDDVAFLVNRFAEPTYLRLGQDARPPGSYVSDYKAWREILPGKRGTMATLGPLVGVAWQALVDLPQQKRPALWAVCEFDEESIPDLFWSQLADAPLYVLEEHVAQGGLGMHLAMAVARQGVTCKTVVHRHALGYPTGRFGSQDFHRAQCGLNAASIRSMIMDNL